MNSIDRDELVTEHLEQGILTLTLGKPPAHALSMGMIRSLHRALDRAAENPEVRVVLLYGPGRIFCAGHDMKEMARSRRAEDDGKALLTELFQACSKMMQRLAQLPKPTIAVVEGIATAAGLQLVASCDLAFAAPSASFCLPGVQNGGFCSTPAVAVARSVSRKHVMEMALSGERFDSDWALSAGLINRIFAEEKLMPETQDFARTLASRHAPAVFAGKAALLQQIELPLDQAYELATEAMLGHILDPARAAADKERWDRD